MPARGGHHARFAGFLGLLALLAVFAAPAWHHHDDSKGSHPECAVCTAVTQDKTDGPPPISAAVFPAAPVATLAVAASDDPSIAGVHECRARGPPSA